MLVEKIVEESWVLAIMLNKTSALLLNQFQILLCEQSQLELFQRRFVKISSICIFGVQVHMGNFLHLITSNALQVRFVKFQLELISE